MTRPLNPITTISSLVDSGRQTGDPASPASVNALAVPMSHVAGRIAPIYNMRPTAHATNSDASVTVGGWDLPFYPTHGLWRDDDENALDGASAGAFIGPVFPQFGNAFSLALSGYIVHPSAPTDRSALRGVEIDLSEEWDDLSATATNTDTAHPPLVVRRLPFDDPGARLDAHALAALYADAGMYNLTCRDISGADMAGSGMVSAVAVQTGKTSAVTTDPDAHVITDLAIGDVGTVATRARLYVGSATVQGITSDDSDTASVTSTGYTVIPDVNTIVRAFGSPQPLSGQMLTAAVRDLIHLDRTNYGARGQVLLSHARKETTTQTEPCAALWSASSSNWSTAVLSAYFRLPSDALPGSENQTTSGTGSTATTRGALTARVIIYRAKVTIGIRKVTIAGSYGQSTTYGSWVTSSATHSSASWAGKDIEILFPSGIAPGDDYEIAIWWKSAGASNGYLRAWTVWEPPLTSVAP
jgi:hypothetical protein